MRVAFKYFVIIIIGKCPSPISCFEFFIDFIILRELLCIVKFYHLGTNLYFLECYFSSNPFSVALVELFSDTLQLTIFSLGNVWKEEDPGRREQNFSII